MSWVPMFSSWLFDSEEEPAVTQRQISGIRTHRYVVCTSLPFCWMALGTHSCSSPYCMKTLTKKDFRTASVSDNSGIGVFEMRRIVRRRNSNASFTALKWIGKTKQIQQNTNFEVLFNYFKVCGSLRVFVIKSWLINEIKVFPHKSWNILRPVYSFILEMLEVLHIMNPGSTKGVYIKSTQKKQKC